MREAAQNPEALLHAVGAYLVGRSQRAFSDQARGPVRWQERAVPNRIGILEDLRAGKNPPSRRFDNRPAAVDTGRLRQSIAYEVRGDVVSVGSRLPYASEVQRGATKTVTIDAGLRRSLAEWLRGLSQERRREAGRAMGFLFRVGRLTVTTPPRPFVMVTDEDRRFITDLARKFYGGQYLR